MGEKTLNINWPAWIKASRLPSNAYILFPLLLGAALYKMQTGILSYQLVVVSVVFGVAIHLYIVYANDYADYEIDKLNKTFTPFSGGSRVLVDGELSRRQIGAAALAALGVCLLTGLLLVYLDRPAGPVFTALSLLLLWAYSYPPVKLSYRGGGELLQMGGVGLLLPVFGYYIQSGGIALFPSSYLAVLLPLNLACAVSTTLPDEPSDRLGCKRTFSVLTGLENAKLLVILLYIAALLFYIMDAGKYLSQTRQISVTGLPFLAALGMVRFRAQALPGNRAMLYFVVCSILLTVSFTAGIAVECFTRF
jgi:1,4-dihydroxy-2-naphthoate octaprenyltransferase